MLLTSKTQMAALNCQQYPVRSLDTCAYNIQTHILVLNCIIITCSNTQVFLPGHSRPETGGTAVRKQVSTWRVVWVRVCGFRCVYAQMSWEVIKSTKQPKHN